MSDEEGTIGERIFGRLARHAMETGNETLLDMLLPDGSARQRQWSAEDGWLIVYTTEPVDRGRWRGKFVVMAYRPEGKGSRSGNPSSWRRVYARPFTRRKDAKARALVLYGQHSPSWAARSKRREEAPIEA